MQWPRFNEEYNKWAISMGANVSLSQTKALKAGDATLPRRVTRERFLTPFFRTFVVEEGTPLMSVGIKKGAA